MPYFPGRWFPRTNDPKACALYCASILAVLKPWRSVTDLKSPDAAEERVSMQLATEWSTASHEPGEHLDNEQDDDPSHDCIVNDEVKDNGDISEADVEDVMRERFSSKEQLYASVAINIGEEVGVFDQTGTRAVNYDEHAQVAKEEDLVQLQHWKQDIERADESLGEVLREMIKETRNHDENINRDSIGGSEMSSERVILEEVKEVDRNQEDYWQELNDEQLMALTILHNHLLSHLAGNDTHCNWLRRNREIETHRCDNDNV
ncbi:hypothetical protein BDN67DRAFT_984166 [Paxillus ammoniavirescens]|nr:hypothetical protein BDN67DRAFT_984166 [Paxillus ammoniavirescens]